MSPRQDAECAREVNLGSAKSGAKEREHAPRSPRVPAPATELLRRACLPELFSSSLPQPSPPAPKRAGQPLALRRASSRSGTTWDRARAARCSPERSRGTRARCGRWSTFSPTGGCACARRATFDGNGEHPGLWAGVVGSLAGPRQPPAAPPAGRAAPAAGSGPLTPSPPDC